MNPRDQTSCETGGRFRSLRVWGLQFGEGMGLVEKLTANVAISHSVFISFILRRGVCFNKKKNLVLSNVKDNQVT